MPQKSTAPAITDAEIIERLAVDVMGWKYLGRKPGTADYKFELIEKDGLPSHFFNWNPLEDWNDWRQVEEQVMEDEELWDTFCAKIGEEICDYMESTLPERCKAVLKAIY